MELEDRLRELLATVQEQTEKASLERRDLASAKEQVEAEAVEMRSQLSRTEETLLAIQIESQQQLRDVVRGSYAQRAETLETAEMMATQRCGSDPSTSNLTMFHFLCLNATRLCNSSLVHGDDFWRNLRPETCSFVLARREVQLRSEYEAEIHEGRASHEHSTVSPQASCR